MTLSVIGKVLVCVEPLIGDVMPKQISVFHFIAVFKTIRTGMTCFVDMYDKCVSRFYIERNGAIAGSSYFVVKRVVESEVEGGSPSEGIVAYNLDLSIEIHISKKEILISADVVTRFSGIMQFYAHILLLGGKCGM